MKNFLKSNVKSFSAWLVILVAVVILVRIVFFGQSDFSSKIQSFETAANNFFVQTLHSDSFMPPPLRGVFSETSNPLTEAGVLSWTNKNREDANVPDLTTNQTLSKMAEQKLQDLFANQYFEHISPSGVGPGDLAKQNGYDYIVIGENLALGNFNGDKALLDAWMASPGHRANILNVRYKEIGIAVGKGTFEGKTTWIAVQEFGLPIDACPVPLSADKTSIDQMKKSVDTLESSLTTQKQAIDNITIKYGSDYDAKINKYNSSVHQFNDLVIKLKAKISDYNKQVQTFNACAELPTTTPELI